MIAIDEEVRIICSKLYFAGYVDKCDAPELLDKEVYSKVQERLSYLGLELVDKSTSRWYVVRLINENDSFKEFHNYNKSLTSRHLALLLILYTKLLLPLRSGNSKNEELKVTFAELYQMYGYKFKSSTRRITSEKTMRGLFTTLTKLNYIIKPYGKDYYVVGPMMYTLHDELLADFAEESLKSLYLRDEEEYINNVKNI